MCFCETAIQEKQNLEKKLGQLNAFLNKKDPSGSLRCLEKNGRCYYYESAYDSRSKKEHRDYIPKENRKHAEELALAIYARDLAAEYAGEIKAIDSYLKKHYSHPVAKDKLEKRSRGFQALVLPRLQALDEAGMAWQSADYSKCPYYPEQKTVRTITGELVRSKSEALILSVLVMYHLPFRYECELALGEHVYYPDFTIFHPVTHELFYFEHFGMMDSARYADAAYNKLRTYNRHGILQTKNLITTFESSDSELDIQYVEALISHHFS